jgi:cytochrome c553
MNDTFWIGVYPGLDAEKTAYMIGQIKAFTEGARTKG